MASQILHLDRGGSLLLLLLHCFKILIQFMQNSNTLVPGCLCLRSLRGLSQGSIYLKAFCVGKLRLTWLLLIKLIRNFSESEGTQPNAVFGLFF